MSNPKKTVRVQVNLANLLKNIRYTFTSEMSVIKELLQNARRAGATRIDVSYDPTSETLEIRDNGCGIADMQDLLSVAESGWDQQLQDEEHSYGMGWLSCLYAGKDVTVESNGFRLSFSTDRALAMSDMEVDAIDPPAAPGTLVRLSGFAIKNKEYFPESMQREVRGFPTPVYLNGEALPRPHALDSGLTFAATSVGQIHFQDIHDTDSGKPDIAKGGHGAATLYLQGFVVGTVGYDPYNSKNVVHLDSASFLAVPPDRHMLVDADNQKARIQKVIIEFWQDLLRREVPLLDPKFVAMSCAGTIERWDVSELLNDIPYFPKNLYETIGEKPLVTDEYNHFLHNGEKVISREDIESGKIILAYAPNDEDFVAWMALYLHGNACIVTSRRLPENHWATQHVRNVDGSDIVVRLHGEKAPVEFNGIYARFNVMLCRKYVLETPIGNFTSDDESLVLCSMDYAKEIVLDKTGKKLVLKDTIAIIPAKETQPGDAIRQASNYIDENDDFDDHSSTKDYENLSRLVRSLRAESPAELLKEAMGGIDLESMPTIYGKQFVVSINRKGKIEVTPVSKKAA